VAVHNNSASAAYCGVERLTTGSINRKVGLKLKSRSENLVFGPVGAIDELNESGVFYKSILACFARV
jgi:hypothetical protein